MITVRDLGDIHGRRTVDITQTTDDQSSSWNLSLATRDLPALFENNSSNRQAELSIVDRSDITDDPNTMYLPVIESAIVHTGDKARYYYRQKFTSSGESMSPSLTLDGFTEQDAASAKSLEQPFLRILFSVESQAGSGTAGQQTTDTSRQQFSGSQNTTGQGLDQRQNTDMEHVDAGENANGGLDVPRGDQQARERREEPQPA